MSIECMFDSPWLFLGWSIVLIIVASFALALLADAISFIKELFSKNK